MPQLPQHRFFEDWDTWTQPLHKQFDRLLEDVFGDARRAPGALGAFVPKVDVSETDKHYEVTVELPGLEEKDVTVSIANGVLEIRGEKKAEKEEKDDKKHYYRVERSYGSFQRSFSLPPGVDESKIDATFANGVLRLTAPKSAEAKAGTRRIAVRKG